MRLLTASARAPVWNVVWIGKDPWVDVGSIEDFPPGSVTPFGDAVEPLAFHVVRVDAGKLPALVARVPHPDPECVVAYRPDFSLHGRTGWCLDTCRPFTYDLAGHETHPRVSLPRGLDRLAVEVRDGEVYVDRTAVTPGERRPPEGHEFQAGGVLLPLRWLHRD